MEIHDRLTRVALEGQGQEGIAQAVHGLTGYPVAIEDRFGNLRAWASRGVRELSQGQPEAPGQAAAARDGGGWPDQREGERLFRRLGSAGPLLECLFCMIRMDGRGG